MPRPVTKDHVAHYRRCPRLLWWSEHDPTAAAALAPGEDAQVHIENGREFERAALAALGDAVDVAGADSAVELKVRATAEALRSGASRLRKPGFLGDGAYAAPDLLERRGTGWALVEVKGALARDALKGEYLLDAAVQLVVVRAAGVDAPAVELLLANPDVAAPVGPEFFVRRDVTAEAEALRDEVRDALRAARAVLDAPEVPATPVGPHCLTGGLCPLLDRCWGDRGDHHVTTLYRGGANARAWGLVTAGIQRIADIPEDHPLEPIQRRQRTAVRAGRVVVEPGLRAALRALGAPVTHLDFESVAFGVPVWDGDHAHEQVPVQYAVLVEDDPRPHRRFVPDGPGDPRRALAEALVRDVPPAGPVIVWNEPFEKGCLALLASRFPDLAPALRDIRERVVDLLKIVRAQVYHPEFRGSFTLKRVLPVLTELSYDDLAIQQGMAATRDLRRLLTDHALDAAERARMVADLSAYCDRDVEATAAVLAALRRLV
jgi:hypothetical protein